MTHTDPLAETQRVRRADVLAACRRHAFPVPAVPGVALQVVMMGEDLYFAALTMGAEELLWRVEVGES